jgi:hypothetical protein
VPDHLLLVVTQRPLTPAMNKKPARHALTSPLALVHVVRIQQSKTSDVPRNESLVVKFAVHSYHVVSTLATNHVIDLGNAIHVLKSAINRNEFVDTHVPLNVMLRLDVPRMILVHHSSSRLALVVICNR